MMRKTRFQVLIKAISAIVLLTFLYNQIFTVNPSPFGHKRNLGSGFDGRIMGEIHENSSNISYVVDESVENGNMALVGPQICDEFFNYNGSFSPCDYLIAHAECISGGFFNYIKFFYCDCKNFSFFGYLVLAAWLVVLFYLVGNTAADYFCCSLEKLSDLLKMSPTVAGITLLPLGNGAPDVFATIAAFVGTGSGDVGVNSVLGGAVFITCVVVGVISLSTADKRVQIDRTCFIRDISFFIFTIVCLTLILVIGKVNIWGAMAFVSIYVVYALFVAINEILQKKGQSLKLDHLTPLLPMAGSFFSCKDEENDSINAALLSPNDDNNPPDLSPKRQNLIWNSNVSIYSDYVQTNTDDSPKPLWGWTDEGMIDESSPFSFSKLCSVLEIPLTVPRRLTIPIVEEDRWSKKYAVGSAFFAPLLLAFLWNTRANVGHLSGKIAYLFGFGVGSILGLLSFIYTNNDHPPRKFLFSWVFGGFFMSIIWFYIIANELVSLLVSLGAILGISPSMLALTILAWGNSMGDLMSNCALAMKERNGLQIAMSGCYAGPMFNTLVGLGVSLLLGSWSLGSEPYELQRDNGLFITMGFLMAALIWSLVVLPQSDMCPNKVFGVGLITIYLLFLFVRIIVAIGWGLGPGLLHGTGVRLLYI